jgi:hypothetical protein
MQAANQLRPTFPTTLGKAPPPSIPNPAPLSLKDQVNQKRLEASMYSKHKNTAKPHPKPVIAQEPRSKGSTYQKPSGKPWTERRHTPSKKRRRPELVGEKARRSPFEEDFSDIDDIDDNDDEDDDEGNEMFELADKDDALLNYEYLEDDSDDEVSLFPHFKKEQNKKARRAENRAAAQKRLGWEKSTVFVVLVFVVLRVFAEVFVFNSSLAKFFSSNETVEEL